MKELLALKKHYKTKGIDKLHYVRHSVDGDTWYCGYVTLNENHPLHGVSNIENTWCDALRGIDIHGGITYSQRVGDKLIIGFDQNHSGDRGSNINSTMNYVASETHSLAGQLCLIYDKHNENTSMKTNDVTQKDRFFELLEETIEAYDNYKSINI